MKGVHIWSNDPKAWWSGSSESDATKHAEGAGDLVINVNSLSELREVFKGWVDSGQSFDLIDFHTHGSGGRIGIGSEDLEHMNLSSVYTPKIERVCNPDAQIIFTGCNVAETFNGEYFLLRVGEMMLLNSGGTVKGHTGYGFAEVLFSGDVFHPFGNWVTVEIGVGGGGKFFNNHYFIPEKISERINEAEKRIAYYEDKNVFAVGEALKIRTNLNNARMFSFSPTNKNMFYALDELFLVDNKLNKMDLKSGLKAQTDYLKVIKR